MSFFNLNLFHRNWFSKEKKKNCYLSCSGKELKLIKSLYIRLIDSYDYIIPCDYDNPQTDIQSKIDNTSIFIAYLTVDYLKCNKSFFELNYAINKQKESIFLLTSSYEAMAQDIKNSNENQDNLNLIQTIELLKNLKLKDDHYENDQWSDETVKNVNEIIISIMKEEEKSASNIQESINVPLIGEIENIEIVTQKDNENRTFNYRSAIIDDNKIAVITHEIKDNIYYITVYDSKLNITKTHLTTDLNTNLLRPSLIIMNPKSAEILITDNSNGGLFVFDKYFNYKSNHSFGLYSSCDMAVDEETNIVYLISFIKPPVLRLVDLYKGSSNGHYLLFSDKFVPRFIRVLNNQIYIVTACSLKIEPNNTVSQYSGESKILVLDKQSVECKFTIDLSPQFSQPWGLIVDKDLNIYTTVFKTDEDDFINNRYLCKINKHGQGVKLTSIRINYLQNDIHFLQNSFYIIKENQISKYNRIKLNSNLEDEPIIVDKEDSMDMSSYSIIDDPVFNLFLQ